MQKNKQPREFIKQFKGIFKKVITIKIPDEPNSCNPYDLKKMAQQFNIDCDVATNFQSAIKKLSNKREKIIASFGSLYLVGKILDLN